MTIQQAFALAVQHQQAGRLAEAEALYRQILAVHPDHPDALHLLGTIAHQVGRQDLAVEWIRRALLFQPNFAAAHYNLGNALREQKRFEEAIVAYERAVDLQPDFAEAHHNLGIAFKERGQLDEAIVAYRRALELQPDFAEAHNNLGITFKEHGQIEEAIAAFRCAIELKPNDADAYNNLGQAFAGHEEMDAAIAAYGRALELKPDLAAAHYNLGDALRSKARFDDAIAAYRRALELQPDYAEAFNNLGVAYKAQGRLDEAIAAYRCALELQPNEAGGYTNLGVAFQERGRLDEAVAAFHRSIELQPDLAQTYIHLGVAFYDAGQFEEAIAAYRRALELQPESAEAHNNLGNALKNRGQFEEAIAAYRRAPELQPDLAEPHYNLGVALKDQGRLDEAIAAYQRALELKPDLAAAHNNLGTAYKDRGELDRALAAFRQSLALDPEQASVHSNLIFSLHSDPRSDAVALAGEQQRWRERFSEPLRDFIRPHINDRSPDRRLRIGYVSSDFRDHVAGRNILPLFQEHDHRYFEIICYSGCARPDPLTAEFLRYADLWRSTVGTGDEALAEMIRRDGIDILVDLAQHSAGNRLPAFARKPAPVQMSFAGYPESTGLETIEYRLSDRWLERGMRNVESGWKPNSAFSTERVFLLDSFWCYDPHGTEIEVNDLPAYTNGWVTLGCLSNFNKVNELVIELWAQVLDQVEGARLAILCDEGSHRQRTSQLFERAGIEAGRIAYFSWSPRPDYLALYHHLDIVLDPFPYNGHTTSLDALWMGVPVVSLAGETRVSRGGLSILSNIGLPELVAHSKENYVAIASQLARDLPRLAELRRTLRSRMEASVLMDAPRFARGIEAAYRAAWRRWCAEKIDP